MKAFLFSLFISSSLLFSCNQSKIDSSNDTFQKRLSYLKDSNEISGINLAIIYNNGEHKSYSVGMADIENETALTDNHVLFSGSIGKTYAVAVLMQLVDEGRVELNEKILNYFPENEWLKELPNINDITVVMLLQHTTGLPRYVMKPEVWDTLKANPDKEWTYFDRLSFIFNDEPVHESGKAWAYSDSNYILIGMLIEKVTGNYYYDEVNSRILIPYGLEETFAAVYREIPNLPQGYCKLPDWFEMPYKTVENGKYWFNPQMEWTGGGFASTTLDLAKWAKAYYASNIFSDSLMRLVITPNANGLNTGKNEAYGMGSFIYESEIGKIYAHTGFVPGFTSIFAYVPEKKLAIAMQINCDWSKCKMSLVDYLVFILK